MDPVQTEKRPTKSKPSHKSDSTTPKKPSSTTPRPKDRTDKEKRKKSDKPEKKKPRKSLKSLGTPSNGLTHLINPDEITFGRELGSGNFGQVFLGECRGLPVAVKRLHQQQLDEQVLEEFKKEVGMMVTLTHPNLVLFIGACAQPGNLQIITEFMCMGDLSDVLQDKKIELSFVQKCKMAKDITNAMMWLHNCKPPVIHRDLKPRNLLVGSNFIVKLCDFGLSVYQLDKFLQDKGVAGGSMLWMSPEVLRGKPFSEKRDIYAFGLVLWELFTGDEPFGDYFEVNEFVTAIVEREERPPLAKLPKNLAKLIDACWSQKPELRPSMTKIFPWVNNIMIEVLPCPAATTMWKNNWPENHEVSFAMFGTAMAKRFGEIFDPEKPNARYQALKRLLCPGQLQATVKLERFALVLNWIGAFEVPNQGQWMERMISLMQQPWFHGDISRPACEKLVYAFKRDNSWLVRFSLTDASRSPFTLSRLMKKGGLTVSHNRISRSSDGETLSIVFDIKQGQQKLEAKSLVDLMKLAKKPLSLKDDSVVLGSMYADLFTPVAKDVITSIAPVPIPDSSSSTSEF